MPTLKAQIKFLMIFLLGLLAGFTACWVNSYQFNEVTRDQHELLENIMAHSEVVISEENYACEGRAVPTVGAVLASLIESNKVNSRNMLSYGCFNRTCTVSLSNCKPWQEHECSTRFLKFNVNAQNTIQADTFSCFDVP